MENPYASPKSVEPTVLRSTDGMPPFGLRHLLIWFGFALLWVAYNVLMIRFAGDRAMAVSVLFTSVSVARSAALFLGAFVLFTSRRRREGLFEHPGHWLILISCCQDFLNVVFSISFLLTESFGPTWLGTLFLVLPLVLYVWAASQSHGVWRWIFFVHALCSLTPIVLPSEFIGSAIVYLVSFLDVSILVVAVTEAVMHVRRDWVHWLGIVTLAISQALMLYIKLFLF
jgi:hypothetical protein